MPRWAIDDGIPANPCYDSTMKRSDIDLLEHVSEPATLVKARIAAVVDGVAVVPACLRHHVGLRYRRHVASKTFTSEVRAVCG